MNRYRIKIELKNGNYRNYIVRVHSEDIDKTLQRVDEHWQDEKKNHGFVNLGNTYIKIQEIVLYSITRLKWWQRF